MLQLQRQFWPFRPLFPKSFAPKWQPWIELGGRVSNERALAEGNLFAPLFQTPDTILFADVRGMFGDDDAREGNFGLGVRRMLDSGWNIGAYGYFNVRRSSLDNTFHQVTLGVEALSRDVDLRANVYLPVGDTEKRVDLGSSTSVSAAAQAVLTGTTLAIESQVTTTTTEGHLVEKALGGVDGEVGVRLPVFDLNSGLDLRAYAGGYWFDASGVDEIAGPRGRLELTAHDLGGLPGVRLTAGVTVQHDSVRDEQVIGYARLRLPLQSPAAARAAEPLTYMERRMTDAVVRDVDIVSNSRTEVSSSSTFTAEATEDAVNTWNDETVTSVVQVDATTQDQTDLQAALDSAGIGGVVVAQGDFAVNTTTDVGTAVTLLGGGTALRVRGATTGIEVDFNAPGAAGKLEGDASRMIQLGSSGVIGGMTLLNTASDPGLAGGGIWLESVNGAAAFSNVVQTDAGGDPSGIAVLEILQHKAGRQHCDIQSDRYHPAWLQQRRRHRQYRCFGDWLGIPKLERVEQRDRHRQYLDVAFG